jgi:serine protease Do
LSFNRPRRLGRVYTVSGTLLINMVNSTLLIRGLKVIEIHYKMYNIMPKTVSKMIFITLSLITLILVMSFANLNLAKAQNIVGQNNSYANYNASGFPLTQLFSKVQNSVVQVTSSSQDSLNAFKSGLGSGFVYDKDGHIITNYHVISSLPDSEGTSSKNYGNISVTFSNGVSYDAKIVGSDPFSDIAVLQVQNISSATKLEPLPLANSLELKIGEPVIAIGNPFGLSGSMTEGIVSGLGRSIPSSESLPSTPDEVPSPFILPSPDQQFIPPSREQTSSFSLPDIIQTDAPINPGNSGGPLLNLKGEVAGMNTAIFSSTGEFAGIGFAIPSNTIKKVVPSLINSGSYTHPWIGIVGTDITPEIAHASGLEEARGFLVTDVTANSPADKSGIRGGYKISDIHGKQIPLGGDVIQAIDNKTIRKIEDMLTYLEREKNVGDAINLTIFRDGKPAEINLTLAARPDSGQQALQKEQRPSLGISGTNITPGIARAMNLTQIRDGFLVLDIIAGGPADKAGIRGGDKIASINGTEIRLGGDVITKIDNQTVRKLDDMLDYLRTKEVGDVAHLQVLRDGKITNLSITLGTNQGLSNPTEQLLPPPDSNLQPSPSPDLPNMPFDDFYGKCTELVGKEICDHMFGK